MNTEEETIKAFARPIAPFGLDGNVLKLFIGALIEIKRVKAQLDIKSLLLIKPKLKTQIRRSRQIIEQVVLNHDLLCACPDKGGCQKSK